MTIKNILGTLLKVIPGDHKRQLAAHLGVPDVRWSLMQLGRFGFAPKYAMDVGAYVGDWTRTCLEVFPDVTLTCIEPQASCQDRLKALQKNNERIKLIQTLLGRFEKDTVPFEEKGSGSSLLLKVDRPSETKPMTTIDALIKTGKCQPPELLKLDVQGYEIEILEGWHIGFEHCEVIQCEISLLPIVPGAPLLHEVIAYLYSRSFVMFDVEELIRAPSDGAVWQIDGIFCRVDSPLRTNRVWRTKSPIV